MSPFCFHVENMRHSLKVNIIFFYQAFLTSFRSTSVPSKLVNLFLLSHNPPSIHTETLYDKSTHSLHCNTYESHLQNNSLTYNTLMEIDKVVGSQYWKISYSIQNFKQFVDLESLNRPDLKFISEDNWSKMGVQCE